MGRRLETDKYGRVTIDGTLDKPRQKSLSEALKSFLKRLVKSLKRFAGIGRISDIM